MALLAAVVGCVLLAVPAMASATDFCVGEPAGCGGEPVSANGLAGLLVKAETNGTEDRVFLGVGIFENGPLTYDSPEKLELIGIGNNQSVLRSAVPGTVFTLGGNPASTISKVTVQASGNATRGLALDGTHAEGATVDVFTANSLDIALTLSGAAGFSRGVVGIKDRDAIGAAIADTGTITDSSIDVPNGKAIFSEGSDVTVRRSRLRARFGAGVLGGHLTMSDTLIDVRDVFNGAGVRTTTSLAGPTLVELDRLTIVGSSDIAGVMAEANGAGDSATIRLRNSIISGLNPLVRLGTNGGVANLSTDRSNYPDNSRVFNSGPGSLVEERRLNVNPGFVNAASSDFHLAADSPLIDAGTPGELPADALDRDGGPRASDGDGDCVHVSDIGAFELQGTKVTAVATAGAASVRAGQPVDFSSGGSCIPGPGEPQAIWSFDDGAGATGAAVSHAFTTAGPHTATLTVTDGAGHQASATARVEVTGGGTSPAAPVLSRLTVSPKGIAIGRPLPRLVSKRARPPAGTIAFTLSKPARVVLRFAQLRRGGKPHPLKTRVRVRAKQGRNRVRFAGRLSRRVRLTPGAYKLTAIAIDAAGARSKPLSRRFTALRATS